MPARGAPELARMILDRFGDHISPTQLAPLPQVDKEPEDRLIDLWCDGEALLSEVRLGLLELFQELLESAGELAVYADSVACRRVQAVFWLLEHTRPPELLSALRRLVQLRLKLPPDSRYGDLDTQAFRTLVSYNHPDDEAEFCAALTDPGRYSTALLHFVLHGANPEEAIFRAMDQCLAYRDLRVLGLALHFLSQRDPSGWEAKVAALARRLRSELAEFMIAAGREMILTPGWNEKLAAAVRLGLQSGKEDQS